MVDTILLFWGILIPTLVIAAGIWLFLKLFSSKKTHNGDEEARVVQECYERLSQMEQRVESLETLLLERAGSHSATPPATPADVPPSAPPNAPKS